MPEERMRNLPSSSFIFTGWVDTQVSICTILLTKRRIVNFLTICNVLVMPKRYSTSQHLQIDKIIRYGEAVIAVHVEAAHDTYSR